MKRSFYLLVLFVYFSLASCSSLAPGSQPASVPAPSSIPVQNTPLISPSPSATQPQPTATTLQSTATQPQPSASPLPNTAVPVEPTATVVLPTPTEIPAAPGPASLNLADPALFRVPLANYTDELTSDMELTLKGKALKLDLLVSVRTQTVPAPAWVKTANYFGQPQNTQRVSLGGIRYSIDESGHCTQGPPAAAPLGAMAQLAGQLTGRAQRVEQRVQLNGILADRYTLQPANFRPDSQVQWVEKEHQMGGSSTLTVTLEVHGSGSLYLAQRGGYILQIDMSGTSHNYPSSGGSQTGIPAKTNYHFKILPTAPETDPVAVPSGCQPLPTVPAGLDYPLLSDAQIVTSGQGQLMYRSYQGLQEAIDFYQEQMPQAGWSSGELSQIGPLNKLVFTKGDQTLTITLVKSGETLTVTIIAS